MRNPIPIPKLILLPSLVCLSFYVGVQIVGGTDASFASQVSPAPLSISTAIVFPSSIKKLEDDAQKIEDKIIQDYKTIISPSPDLSLQEQHKKLARIKELETEISVQVKSLQNIKKKLSTYDLQIKNQKESNLQNYAYVNKGYQNVLSNWNEVQSVVNFHHIEEVRSSVYLQISRLQDLKSKDEHSMKSEVR